MDNTREIVAEIIDCFEDLLAEHNIIIPSEDRDGYEDECAIFGREYYDLEDKITCLLQEKFSVEEEK